MIGCRRPGSVASDAINSVFDADYDVSLWQGQLVETHTAIVGAAVLGLRLPLRLSCACACGSLH